MWDIQRTEVEVNALLNIAKPILNIGKKMMFCDKETSMDSFQGILKLTDAICDSMQRKQHDAGDVDTTLTVAADFSHIFVQIFLLCV